MLNFEELYLLYLVVKNILQATRASAIVELSAPINIKKKHKCHFSSSTQQQHNRAPEKGRRSFGLQRRHRGGVDS